MKCKMCEFIYKEDLISCPRCGASFFYKTDDEQKRENNILILAILLAVLTFTFFILHGNPYRKIFIGFSSFQLLRAQFISISFLVIPALIFLTIPQLQSKKLVRFSLFYILLFSIALLSASNFYNNELDSFLAQNPNYELKNNGKYGLSSYYKTKKAKKDADSEREFIEKSGCLESEGYDSYHECLNFMYEEAYNEGRDIGRFN